MLSLRLLLFASFALALPGQTRIHAGAPACPPGAAPRVYAELPAMIGATRVMVPLCLELGSGFQIDPGTTPPTLRTAPAATSLPWLAVDRVDLGALSIPMEQTELTYTLTRTPVDGSAMFAILQGRPFGLVEVAITDGRDVVITLPAGPRPFVAGQDLLVLVYLTTANRPASR